MDEEVILTKHAEMRIRERSGLNKKAAKRIAMSAYNRGISHKDTKGNLNKWVTSVYFNSPHECVVKLYGDKAFIFRGNTLITVLQIPSNLRNNMKVLVRRNNEKDICN